MVGAADAAAQLMQLREPKAVRTVDYDRVGSRDIEPRLDDRRAQEEIAALLVELAHDALELALGHLTVRDREPRLGHERCELLGLGPDGGDVVVQIIDLAAALELAQHGFAHEARSVWGDESLDGEAAFRRRRDHREIA